MILQRPTGRGYSGFGLTVAYTPEAQAQLVTGVNATGASITGQTVEVVRDSSGNPIEVIRNYVPPAWLKQAALAGGTLALALALHKFFTRKRRR